MKYLLTILCAGLFCITSHSQAIETIKENLYAGKIADAKSGIDKLMSNPKKLGKAEVWYFKALIYNSFAKDNALNQQNPATRAEAFEAYKKYLELDPKNELGTANQNGVLFDLAYNYDSMAFKAFNDQRFEDSYNAFKKLEELESFIVKNNFKYNNFSYPALDTQLYQNISAAASKCGKMGDAISYYEKLMEKDVIGPNLKDAYKFVVSYQYDTLKDVARAAQYAALGHKLYPDDPFWCAYPLSGLERNPEKLFAEYDKLLKTDYCVTYYNLYNYSVELFNYCFTGDKKSDFGEKKNKLLEIITKTVETNSTPEANLLAARTFYEDAWTYEDIKIAQKKANKPVPPELLKSLENSWDKVLKYATVAVDYYKAKSSMSSLDKGNYKISLNFLVEYYTNKKQMDKADEYRQLIKAQN